jgi:uncharacterized membrane protein (UPF0136 family)
MINLASPLLFYYGIFLIICGIVAVSFIGLKAKTALVSGGTSGVIAIAVGHFVSTGATWATAASIAVPLLLLCVFSWRATKTLFTLMEMVRQPHEDFKGKAIAFLIISLMAVVSIFVLLLILVSFHLH